MRENIVRQLTKLGGTPYTCANVDIPADFNYFIPSSLLSELRRQVVSLREALSLDGANYQIERSKLPDRTIPAYHVPYLYNVSNHLASQFYQLQGIKTGDAFELQQPSQPLIMQCRHCLRYALGFCVKNGGRRPEWKEPLSLRLGDGRLFRLEFDCRHCQMNVYAHE